MSYSINDKCIYRTASATPGLLNITWAMPTLACTAVTPTPDPSPAAAALLVRFPQHSAGFLLGENTGENVVTEHGHRQMN